MPGACRVTVVSVACHILFQQASHVGTITLFNPSRNDLGTRMAIVLLRCSCKPQVGLQVCHDAREGKVQADDPILPDAAALTCLTESVHCCWWLLAVGLPNAVTTSCTQFQPQMLCIRQPLSLSATCVGIGGLQLRLQPDHPHGGGG
jgi:hypothetical protein